jgi:hypothetical protein
VRRQLEIEHPKASSFSERVRSDLRIYLIGVAFGAAVSTALLFLQPIFWVAIGVEASSWPPPQLGVAIAVVLLIPALLSGCGVPRVVLRASGLLLGVGVVPPVVLWLTRP